MFDPFSVIAAVATAATAVFMYPNFLASRPTIDVCIDDVPNRVVTMSELITSASELPYFSLQLGNLTVVSIYCSAGHDDAEAER